MAGAGRANQDLIGVSGTVNIGSCDVLVNNKGAIRRGDLVKPHLSIKGKKHPPVPMVQGTCAVLVNHRPIVRAGHLAACGDSLVLGSCNVQVGDQNRIPELDLNQSTLFIYDNSAPSADQPTYTDPNVVSNPNVYYNPAYTAEGRNQEKPNKAPDFAENSGVQDQPATQCQGTSLTVIPFLQRCLQEAKNGLWRETGQGGSTSNTNILNIWKNLGLSFSSDQVPWCAGFACFAMKQSGMKWIREAGARNLVNKYAQYDGYPVPISQMQPGDLVLWSSTHVNFCYTANNGRYTFVGGNQSPTSTSGPPVRDSKNDGDVTVSWPGGWTIDRGGIERVIRIKC